MARRYRTRAATADDVPRLIEMLVRMDAHVAGVDPQDLALNEQGHRDLERRMSGLIDNPWAHVVVATTQRGDIVAMGDVGIWHHPNFWHNPDRQGMSSAVIDDVWVEPDHRRRGLTKQVLDELVEFVAERGVEELTLEYSLANAEADAVWKRLGFRPTGVRAAATVSQVRARLGQDMGERH